MKKARYANVDGDLVDPVEFVSRAPANYRDRHIFPYCDACHQIVHVYGVNTPNPDTVPRFDHANLLPDADPLDDCVLANRTDRFRGMEPDYYDDVQGELLREQFLESDNLKMAYAFCLVLCGTGNLPKSKFRSMLRRADKKRIWSYAGIQVWAIPYILLTLEDFIAVNKSGKEYGFHFVFKKRRGSNVSAIWNNTYPCALIKLYADSGNPVINAHPLPVSQAELIRKAGISSWVKLEGLIP
jgi:hypothetical protein